MVNGIEKDVKPLFVKAQNVPYAMNDKVETEIERLRNEGVIEEVTHSEWATHIVPILMRDGTIRICGDYTITINKVSKLDFYPIPRIGTYQGACPNSVPWIYQTHTYKCH